WQELGVTGEGITIGHADSGADATHPALASGYRGRTMGDVYNWFDPWYGRPQPADDSGHGTYTLAIAVGRDGFGVAPGASWFSCVNLARNLGHVAYYLDCMQFMLAPHPPDGDPLRDGRPDLAADVSTNSWGCPPELEGCDQLTLWQATAALRAAGIFFVAAAGNEGPACDSLRTPPGNYGNVLSVGAIDQDGELAAFSNRGPHTQAPDGNTAPDVLAPGVAVTSAWPGGGRHTSAGTSAAAPHVAGVVALMWSANPRLRGDVETTERILQETAAPYRGQPDGCGVEGEFPDSGAGYGVVDAFAAVRRALELP
ncbi:MAG: S8 family serine peptidase, partial [Caldilineales bacterium]|nr:S8 family serine peptidase [Caldilineales bacterium]